MDRQRDRQMDGRTEAITILQKHGDNYVLLSWALSYLENFHCIIAFLSLLHCGV